MTLEVFKGKGVFHPWYVRLRADNGQIVDVSEGYLTKWNAKRAAKKRQSKYLERVPIVFV